MLHQKQLTEKYQKNQIHVVKSIAYILAILMFCFNYNICNYFYYNDEIKDISKWWDLKSNMYAIIMTLVFYAIIMMLIFYASLLNTKGILKVILNIGLGLCLSNVIDKLFFNVINFQFNDVLMIIITICFSFYNYLKELKK